MEKVCRTCGKSFSATAHQHKYCSKQCRPCELRAKELSELRAKTKESIHQQRQDDAVSQIIETPDVECAVCRIIVPAIAATGSRCNACYTYGRVVNKCQFCCKEFPGRYGKAYCSPECRRGSQLKARQQRRQNSVKRAGQSLEVYGAASERHKNGGVAEAMFDVWAIRMGYATFRPALDCCPLVDRVILMDGAWVGVQIKKRVTCVSDRGQDHKYRSVTPMLNKLRGFPWCGALAIVDIDENTIEFLRIPD